MKLARRAEDAGANKGMSAKIIVLAPVDRDTGIQEFALMPLNNHDV